MKRFICIVPLLFAFVLARQTSSVWFGDYTATNETSQKEEAIKRSARAVDNDTPGDSQNKYVLEASCLAGLRAQMNLEMHASLVYQQMAAHFNSNQVARKGFAKFFQHNSDEEREHAQKIIDYVNSRGATIGNINVAMPDAVSWKGAREALQAALELENKVNNELHGLHRTAEHDCHDPQLQDFLEGTFLNEQVESIAHLERLITNLDKFTDVHLGEYFLNKDLLE